ncbi:hypothetical protein V6N11_039542 [Hibiscus sabdariffa]|uniref:Myb/SANT-like domain-containing protein n=1 Tax=Hibiscus sabdariffa TaxID=183260 RepID=A0ABR2SP44_9ROSI
MKETPIVEPNGEKVKASWDTRTTKIFCDLCIKEILDGNRPGTHFKKEAWNRIVNIFENETGKAYTQRQLKNRLQVVPEAQRFRTAGIDPELEEKLDQMFRGIVATGDKAWAPSSGILPSDFVEHYDIEALDEIEEENAISNGNDESPQVGGAAKLSMQIDKLCSAADNMSHATSRLTPAMDPFGIQHAIKILDGLSEEVPKASELYFFALNLIVNKEKRTVFLSIDPEIRIWWLKREMEESSKLSSFLRP